MGASRKLLSLLLTVVLSIGRVSGFGIRRRGLGGNGASLTARSDDATQSALRVSGENTAADADSTEASAPSDAESIDGADVVDPKEASPLSYMLVERPFHAHQRRDAARRGGTCGRWGVPRRRCVRDRGSGFDKQVRVPLTLSVSGAAFRDRRESALDRDA